jgi:hypothetical protein
LSRNGKMNSRPLCSARALQSAHIYEYLDAGGGLGDEPRRKRELASEPKRSGSARSAGRKPSDPHHLRYMQPRALGRKASDEFTVPFCRVHHRAAHRAGDERAWWKAAGIDPMKFTRRLWKQTRVKEGRLPADEIMQTPQSGLALNSQSIGSTGRDIG